MNVLSKVFLRRLFVCLVLCFLLGGCASFNAEKAPDYGISQKDVNAILESQEFRAGQIWLVPVGDIKESQLVPLAARLSKETDLVIRVSKNMDMPKLDFHKNFVAFADVIPARTTSSVFIAIADSKNLQCDLMLSNLDGVHALINYAKIKDDSDAQLSAERLYKLVKRAIGLVYYHSDYSEDSADIMYRPLKSLQDLDKI